MIAAGPGGLGGGKGGDQHASGSAARDWVFSRVAAQPGSQAPQRCSRRRRVPRAQRIDESN